MGQVHLLECRVFRVGEIQSHRVEEKFAGYIMGNQVLKVVKHSSESSGSASICQKKLREKGPG